MMIVFEWPTHGKLTFSGDNTITSAIFLCLLSPPNRVTDRVLLVTYLKTLSDCGPHALPPGAFVLERPSSLTLSRACESDEDGWLPITLAVLEIQDCMQAMPLGMEICFSFFLFPDTHTRLRGDYEHVSRLQDIPSSTNVKSKTYICKVSIARVFRAERIGNVSRESRPVCDTVSSCPIQP